MGKFVVAQDLSLLRGLDLDVVLEGTGHPEAGARNAEIAIGAGMHVIMVSKETDSVVGPILSRKAKAAGLVYSLVDGDQPSLLIGLLDWARVIGLDVLTIGKSSEYDFIFDPDAETVFCNGRTVSVPGFGKLWHMGNRPATEVANARAEMLSDLPRHAVPDMCEMTCVANNTDFSPSGNQFLAPVARPREVADMMCPRSMGGLLAGPGMIDVFNCLRLEDGFSFAGGELIVVACHDKKSWEVLREKGHVVSRNNQCAMIGNPRHLLGVESATSVMSAVLLGEPTSSSDPRPRFDLVGRAERDLPAGTVLNAVGHHHMIDGIQAEISEGRAVRGDNAVPYYLLANRTLGQDVAAGSFVTAEVLDGFEGSVLWRLRREQDAIFFG
ncbi:MAG: hypothetical protein H8E94_06345 [Alphaproteobacteria bacterium]|nr:hypothetical protein [Alphaproteobacteria bacterium]